MSSTAFLNWDKDTIGVPVVEWREFCAEHEIVFSPNTVGRNVFYAGEVEVSYGFPDYKSDDPKLPNGGIDFAAIQPPDVDTHHITFSTYYYGDAIPDVARLALLAWKKWGGTLDASEEIRAYIYSAKPVSV